MKIKSAQLGPDLLPTPLQGVVYNARKDGVVISARPTAPKKGWSVLQKQFRTRFALAAKMAAAPGPYEYETALEMSLGTEQVPRDILTMAALGRYYTIIGEDGHQWGHVSGAVKPTPKYRGEGVFIRPVQQQANATSWDPTSNSHKGMTFFSAAEGSIVSMSATILGVAGQVYDFVIGTIDGANVIQTMQSFPANPVTISGQQNIFAITDFPVNTTVEHILLVGTSSGAGTYPFGIVFPVRPSWVGPFNGGTVIYQNGNPPAVGQTVQRIITAGCPLGIEFLPS